MNKNDQADRNYNTVDALQFIVRMIIFLVGSSAWLAIGWWSFRGFILEFTGQCSGWGCF